MCARSSDLMIDRQALLEDLSRFATGGAAEVGARDDPSAVLRGHLPIAEHRRVLDRETLLVLGGRGTGKTQLFRVLRTLKDPSQLLAPEARRAAGHMPDVFKAGFTTDGKFFPTPDVLQRLLVERQLAEPQHLWLGLLIGVLLADTDVAPAMTPNLAPDVLRAFSQELTSPSSWLSLVAANLEALRRALDDADTKLEQDRRVVNVTYDDLDILVSKVSQAYPLIRELLAFWLRNARRWSAIRCKIFLRTDIFEAEEFAFPDSSKLRPLSVTLRWNADNLYRLVLKRLLNGAQSRLWLRFLGKSMSKSKWPDHEQWGIVPTTGEKEHKAFMERVVGQYMGLDKRRGDSYRWILNHLQDSLRDIAPRSFLKLFELSASRQVSKGLPENTKLLAPEEISAALIDVSKDRITELKEEFKGIEGIRSNLRDKVVPMERKDFRKCLREIDWDKFPEHLSKSKDNLINYLISLGILRETSDKRIHVPDIYLFGFGLRRKGGIRRPRA